jgi:hypothetical protein
MAADASTLTPAADAAGHTTDTAEPLRVLDRLREGLNRTFDRLFGLQLRPEELQQLISKDRD